MPVYRGDDGELRVVLVRRTKWGIHGGQIAFPGGKRDPRDESLLATALREAGEEIGLATDSVEILETLSVVETLTTGYRIHPFLGRVAPESHWKIQEREIAEVMEVSLHELTRPDVHGEKLMRRPEWRGTRSIPYYRLGDHDLWGATYRILHPLIPRLLADEWPL